MHLVQYLNIYHLPGLGIFSFLTEFLRFFQYMQIYSKQLSSSSFRCCSFVCFHSDPLTHFFSLTSHFWQPPMCSCYLWDWVFLGFVLDRLEFMCKRYHTVSFSDLFDLVWGLRGPSVLSQVHMHRCVHTVLLYMRILWVT